MLDLILILRGHRFPVTGAHLADRLGISLRTLYRDIATLQAQGATIEGEAGVGYVLRSGFLLPPLMFSEEEIEALVLGSRWVARRTDQRLGRAAQSALCKIATVLPADLREKLESSPLLVGPEEDDRGEKEDLDTLRHLIHAEHKVEIGYRDLKGVDSTRMVWPFALGFFRQAHILVAWCELRQDFRNFRVDRITRLTLSSLRYPVRRRALLRRWREREGIVLD
ncbi:helix-turn-helix transcriptional regulator [Rhodospirillum rubrum]|uniref:helix-turn-helix transcriptional regulator n=1 Tax=Rhodospirillum rubrum TaxID=1085 RepID=UPI001F5B2318|nr:YafY family protein [Rhodospirillum rubrum]